MDYVAIGGYVLAGAAVIGIWTARSVLKSYVPSYLEEKGKNLATKEDIAALTHQVEEVRNEYAMVLERFRENTQLRLAGVDRRLQAHQDAFVLWYKLAMNLHEPSNAANVDECRKWWINNCLYLSGETGSAFVKAFHAASDYEKAIYPISEMDTPEKRAEARRQTSILFENVGKAGDVIRKAVNLPALSPDALAMPTEKGKAVSSQSAVEKQIGAKGRNE